MYGIAEYWQLILRIERKSTVLWQFVKIVKHQVDEREEIIDWIVLILQKGFRDSLFVQFMYVYV